MDLIGIMAFKDIEIRILISIMKYKYRYFRRITTKVLFIAKIVVPLHPHSKNWMFWDDSLAQQVEHIPFKDGVLGSNPRWITNCKENVWGFNQKSLLINRLEGSFDVSTV